MMRKAIAGFGFLAASLWATLALAACPTASGQSYEAYVYGCPATSGPFASSLIIPAVPNSTTAPASSLEGIAANVFLTLTDTQTATNKTFTSPTINGGTLTGTIAGSFTFSGTPVFSAGMTISSISGSTQCLQVNSSGVVSGTGAVCGGSGSVPGGSNTQVQYNNSGVFGGSSGATFNSTKLTSLSIGLGSDATGDIYYNGGSGAFTRLGIGAATTVLHGGSIPAYSAVNLTSDVSGTLPAANGGVGVAGLTQYNVVLGGGVSASLTSTPPNTAGFVLTSNGGSANPTFQAATGGSTPVNFNGAAAGGSSTAYTVATTTPSGFTATAGFRVCTSFTTANGANPTLNVASTGAKPIVAQTGTGQSPIGLSVITNPSTNCFILDASASNYIMDAPQTPEVSPAPATAGGTVTAAQFCSGQQYDINTTSQTLTLPLATTISPGCAIPIKTSLGVTATLTPQSADGINGGTINTSITLPADSIALVNTTGASGTGAFTVNLGTVQYFPMTWASGQNLVQSPVNGLPLGRFSAARTIYGIRCMVNNAVGATAGFDIYATASGTAPASGTKLNTTSCNANTASNTEQDMGITASAVPQGYWIYLVATGTWTSSVGSGAFNLSYR